jgi:hypothetical protein
LPPCYFWGGNVVQNGQCFLFRFVQTESNVQVNPAKQGRRQAAVRYSEKQIKQKDMIDKEILKRIDEIDYQELFDNMKKIANLFYIGPMIDKEISESNMNIYNLIIYTIKCIQQELKKPENRSNDHKQQILEKGLDEHMFVAFIKDVVEKIRTKHEGISDEEIAKMITEDKVDYDELLWKKKKH